MSGKFSNSGSEALATLNTVINKLGKEYSIEKVLNVEPEDGDINGVFNINEVLNSYYEDEVLNNTNTEIRKLKNSKSKEDIDKVNKIQDISNKLKMFGKKLQKMCDTDTTFRKAFMEEAATGNIKFGKTSKSAANC